MHIWKTDSEGQYSFMHVAMHELGHAAGALHEGDTPNLMGIGHGGKRSKYETISGYHVPGAMGRDIQNQVDMKLAIPLTGADFTNGITTVYGIDPAKREDVSISPWKLNGKEPDCVPTPTHQCKLILYYSLHSRKELLYDSGGNQLTPIGSNIDPSYMRSDPVYEITKNKTYQAAFLFENTGKSPALTVQWRAYVSDDDTFEIEKDRSLASDGISYGELTIDRSRGPMSQPLKFKLPTDLPNKDYYVFIVLDPDKKIDEENELDNFTYVKVKTPW